MDVAQQLSRLTGKAKRFLSRHVPYNLRFKPLGVKSLFPNELASVQLFTLRPPYESKLHLSPKFLDDCSSYCKPVMSYHTAGDFVAVIRNGRVFSFNASNTAIISAENYLIEELSFQWVPEQQLSGKHNQVFNQKAFSAPRKYKGKVFSMLAGGGAKTYYYHWMMDCIAKLGLLKEIGMFDDIDYFLVPAYSFRYHREYLDHFGITREKIIVEDDERHIEADYLIATSFVQKKFHHPKWAVDFLYKSFITQAPDRKRDKLIYIPRGDSAINRKVLNEKELIGALEKYGFEIHYLADMAVPDEAALFNSAKLIVGIQGSGFANLVFCEPGAQVLVIFPDAHVRHVEYDLCNKKELDFHYIICPSDRMVDNTLEGQRVNVTADIPAIMEKIDSMLNSPTGSLPIWIRGI